MTELIFENPEASSSQQPTNNNNNTTTSLQQTVIAGTVDKLTSYLTSMNRQGYFQNCFILFRI
jgi:hypothetical protein